MRFRVLTAASLLALAGCHLHSDPPGEAPSGVMVTPGEGLVTVNWNRDPELTYWIFYQPGSSAAPAASGVPLIFDAVPPRVVAGLTNDTQYAFIMNATREDSKAGPSSPVVMATPRLAGKEWASGTALGTNLNGIAFNGSRLVVVGDSGTIFAGDYNYTSTNPRGVTAWMPPTSVPVGTTSLSTVIFSGQQFVALGIDGSILTSTDGLTWTLATGSIPSASMNGIAFGSVSGTGTYVAVGNGGNIFTSTDLVTWTTALSNPSNGNDLFGVAFLNGGFLNGGFVATGASGTLLTSTDGSNWTAPASHTTNALRGAAFRSAPTPVYVVVGDAGTIVTSADGITWSSPITPPPLLQPLNNVVFGSRFVAVGQGGAVVFSDDGSIWSPPTTPPDLANLARVVFTAAMYVAVGEAGANAFAK